MKIAYLANVRLPSERAHATQIVHTIQAFAQNGVYIDLIVNRRRNENIFEIGKYFNLDPKFNLIRISHGFFSAKIKFFFHFSSLWFCISFILKIDYKKYDIIFSREEWLVWLLSLIVSNKRLVWESHEAKLNFPARRILHKRIKFVVISEGIHESYIEYGVPTRQILVAHDGIDESFFAAVETNEQARKRLRIRAGEKIAMYIGGFDEWKGVETFFAASNLCPEISFVAIGGSEREVLKYTKKYPKVTFLGQKPYFDLKDNQQAADVLVVPNSSKVKLSSHYTSPLKLFAHMASGVPLVVSDIPSIVTVTGRDLVTVVQSDKPEALAKGIELVFSNYEAKMMSTQELRKVSMGYTWNQRAKNILNFISQ